jgi:branched-subunit amino acid ABC-type transport system permease component
VPASIIAQMAVSGMLMGLVYALIAYGFQLTYATSKSLNFGQGELVMVSAFVSLSLFPATTADQWGTKSMVLNYGVMFTAWGFGGVLGPTLAGRIADTTGSYAGAYNIAGMLLIFAFVLAMLSYIEVSFDVAQRELKIRLGSAASRRVA